MQRCAPIFTTMCINIAIFSDFLLTVYCGNASGFCKEDALVGAFSVCCVNRCTLKLKLETSRHLIKLGEYNPNAEAPQMCWPLSSLRQCILCKVGPSSAPGSRSAVLLMSTVWLLGSGSHKELLCRQAWP